LKSQYVWFLAAVVLASGCGNQERIESVQLSQVLEQNQAEFAAANSGEKDLINNARAWSGDVTANGPGQGVQLDQDVSVATQLAKSAVDISAQLGQVRQAFYNLSLKQESTQNIRDALISELANRQKILQDIRTMLEQSVPDFVAYRHSKDFKNDTYPVGIQRLDALLQGYKTPADVLGSALSGLKTRYKINGASL
jgi:hypothetical protein